MIIISQNFLLWSVCWGEEGMGAQENRGWEEYGRQEWKGREVGVLKEWEWEK